MRHTRLADTSGGPATAFDSEWEHQLQIWIGELHAQRSTIVESFQKVFSEIREWTILFSADVELR